MIRSLTIKINKTKLAKDLGEESTLKVEGASCQGESTLKVNVFSSLVAGQKSNGINIRRGLQIALVKEPDC